MSLAFLYLRSLIMGGAVSAGEDNDDLVENLVAANYIRSPRLVDIFRAVDRGHYYLKGQRSSAYHDIAWKFNNLHISAPCIYSEVMENLDLQPGMSFLNLGSGTGYLSTMAGLILGPYGVNHGIEIHGDTVDYAKVKVKEFISKSSAFDRFEFCHPQFEVGNCLLLPPDIPGYDRVYCGAACPPEFASYLMNLLNIDGKLVLPLEDQLQVKTRTGQQEWDSKNALAVSFAHLILPSAKNNSTKTTPIPGRDVLPLQEICRFCVRRAIRNRFNIEMPPIKKRKKRERNLSDDLDEQTAARHRQIGIRRRRNNTVGERSSTRRRRMNTSGDSDHAEALQESGDSSDDDQDGDDEMQMAEPDERTDVVDDEVREESLQNELANDTNDITLNDGERADAGAPSGLSDGLSQTASRTDESRKDGEPSGPSNGLSGTASATDESRKDDSSASEPPQRNQSRRYRFRFMRPRPHNRTQQQDTDTPTTSDRNSEAGDQAEQQQGGGEVVVERQPYRQAQPNRLAYALLRGLRRRIRLRDTPHDLQEAINEGVVRSSELQHVITAGAGNSSSESDDDGEKENSGSEEEEIFKPLPETQFSIAIRKLPLPPSLIKYLLYYRQ